MGTVLSQESLKEYIREIPDFPKKGILFKDITPLLKDPGAFQTAVILLADRFLNRKINQIVAVESRGFIFGSAVAYRLKAGFIPVRKKGRLPSATERISYQLEYGEDVLEIHHDSIARGTGVLVIDDLLATGGTAKAVTQLIEKIGGRIEGIGFLVELSFLRGREKLKGYEVHSLIQFPR